MARPGNFYFYVMGIYYEKIGHMLKPLVPKFLCDLSARLTDIAEKRVPASATLKPIVGQPMRPTVTDCRGDCIAALIRYIVHSSPYWPRAAKSVQKRCVRLFSLSVSLGCHVGSWSDGLALSARGQIAARKHLHEKHWAKHYGLDCIDYNATYVSTGILSDVAQMIQRAEQAYSHWYLK